MDPLDELPEYDDLDFINTVYPMTISVGDPAKGEAKGENGGEGTISIDKLLKQYSDRDPGIFSIGGTFGIDSTLFQVELNSVYVSVVNVQGYANVSKLLVVQGIVYVRVGKLITISATLLGAYDPDTLTDPLELFNKKPETEAEREEAMRTRNKFYNLSGDTIQRNDFIGKAGDNNGLYFLLDSNGAVKEKEYVFTAVGLLDLDWLKKIGVNCGLKIGAIGAYNEFKSEWEVGLGVKFTVPSGTEWLAVGRVGFKSGRLNNISLEVKGEIPIGVVVMTQIKIGVSGLAESVQTYAPGLGVAFGPQIEFGALSSKFTKMIGLKSGKFRVAEVAGFGEVSSDWQNMSLSVEGTLCGLLEIKGGWKREDGKHEITLSVGTKQSETFNFRISGSACWGDGALTVKGSLDGSFKWDFTALGITWVGVNVGGGVSVVYNQAASRKTLSIMANGRATVKVGFVKFGVNVSNSWFLDLSSRGLACTCTNTQLQEASSGAKRSLLTAAKAGDTPENIQGEKIGSYSWTSTELAKEGRTYITLAVQYSLVDLQWVLYGADGAVYTSEDLGKPIQVKQVSFSQLELTVDNAAQGDWKLDVYGSRKRNGEVLMYAEAGDPVETDVRIVSMDKQSVTVEYRAHATGEQYLAALYMQRADRPDDEYEGMILDYLAATEGEEYRKVTVNLPEDVQGGKYKFYVMAQSTNCAEVAYSDKTEEVEIAVRTASLKVTDYRVEFQSADLQTAAVFCTVANLGTVDAGDFTVEVLLGDSEVCTDDDLVLTSTTISLAAGARRDLQLTAFVPGEYIGKHAVMSVRLDLLNAVDEGIFEVDNIAMKRLAPTVSDSEKGKVVAWEAVEGAVSYDLEYAVEEDWDDSAVLHGFTENTISLDLAAGHYTFRVTPYDAEGKAITTGIQEWDGAIFFSTVVDLVLDPESESVSTNHIELKDGFYSWTSIDFGDFTGTLTLYQVEGTRRGHDDAIMIADVVNGEVTPGPVTDDILLDSGLYYFTAVGAWNGTTTELSLSLFGDLFPDFGPERGVVSLPDSVDEHGRYSETVESWVGAFDGEDIWEFLLEDAGELSLSVNGAETITGTLVVDLFVQTSANGQYQRAKTFTVDASSSGTLLDQFIVTNNFYVRVGARDNGKGNDNSEYSLNLDFRAFDDDPLDEGEWFLSAGKDPVQVDGWLGYRKASDTYLLTVDNGCAGRYDFKLTGDATEAILNIRSMSGRLIKSVALNKQGEAVLTDFELYSGDYLVEIDSRNNALVGNNTNYTLTVSQKEVFHVISESNFAEVQSAEQGEKLFFALDIQESSLYDMSELQNAGLTVWLQEVTGRGNLGAAKLCKESADLAWDVPTYMTLCNCDSAWGDARIGLDSENHKFVLLAAPSA
jgi:hypothetical protein